MRWVTVNALSHDAPSDVVCQSDRVRQVPAAPAPKDVAYAGGMGRPGATVAQNIVNSTPELQSAVTSVDSAAAVLSPGDATVFAVATAGFDAGAELLVAQAKAYLANPSAGTLAQIQVQIVVLQQQVNTAMLQVARIVNPASQQHALAAIQAVDTVVTVMLSLVNERQAAQMVAAHYGEPVALAQLQMAQVERIQLDAGF